MSVTNRFSAEDNDLCEVNQLGRPLQVYRFKPLYLYLSWWYSLVFCLTGIMGLAATVLYGLSRWDLAHTSIAPSFFVRLLFFSFFSCSVLFLGTVYGRLDRQRLRIGRVLICTHGLLKVTRKRWSDRVEAVFWQDIVDVVDLRRSLFRKSVLIFYAEGKVLRLSNGYQNLDNLLERI